MDRKKLYPWYFTSGALLIFFLLCFLPGIIGIFYSFTDWNNFTDKINFIGFKNYAEVFKGNRNTVHICGIRYYLLQLQQS